VRSIGAGSAAQRTIALERMREYYPMLDTTGQSNLLYDLVAAGVGNDIAERYAPRKQEDRRPANDTKIAILENDHLMQGNTVPVLETEVHLTHLDIHITRQSEILAQAEEGSIPLEEALTPLAALQDHGMQHLALIEGNPMLQEQVGQIRQALQQADEVIGNAQRRVAKMQRDAEEQAAQQPPEGEQTASPQSPNGLTPEMEMKMAQHRLTLQMMEEKARLQMNIELQKFEQKRQIEDAKSAVNLRKFLPATYPA
jgi:hypothetical protein